MMKRCYLVVVYCVLVLWASVVSAQTVKEEGAAVKLGSGATIKNTIVWGNKGKQLEGGKTPVNCHIQGVNGVKSPLFQDSTKSDFRLGKNSPCIDMGADATEFADPAAVDLWGNKRVNNQIDIGANEYRIYQINFIKDPQVGIIQDIAGVTYDSAKVEPGEKYLFKPDYGKIAGITADMVVVQKLEGGEELTADADGVYTLPAVNSDITIKITLTPPIVVTVEEASFGTLTVTRQSNGQKVPDLSGKNSITVDKNEYIRLDTVSTPGYYCDAVFMRLKEPVGSPEVSVRDKVGKDNGIQVTESMFCKAEFKPLSYPVKLRVNDPNMGQLTVVNNKDAETYTLPAGSATYQKSVEYGADKTFGITIANNSGYGIKSVKIYDADGVSNPRDITAAVNRVADMRVGGLVIDVVFAPAQYTVSWNCSNGDLNVTPGTTTNMPGGGKKVEVAYGTVITVQPLANAGYEYVLNSLKAQLGDGTQQVLPDATKQWTVVGNITLSAQFSSLKPLVKIEIDEPNGSNNGVTTNPVLGADNRVDYGASLTLEPAAKPGYHCSEIWVDGVKQVGHSSVGLASIEQDVTVKFVFVPDEFTITYTNLTPSFGTLLLERQQYGTAVWNAYTSSPGKADYLDKVRVTATPVNTHYLLDKLTLTSISAGQTDIASGTEQEVRENLAVEATFKPKEYSVSIKKISGNTDKGIISLKDKATGKQLIELPSGSTSSVVNIPYGTEVLIEWACDQGYGMKSVNKTVGGITESVLVSRVFTVEEDTEVVFEIYQSTQFYSINWKIVEPGGSVGNELEVYENIEGDIALGATREEGTPLQIETETASGDTLVALTDQFGNAVSTGYRLNQDLEVTAKFVRKCTVRISNPGGATVAVSKDGVVLADGTLVPAGSALQCMITANNSSVGCKSLTVNSVECWTGTITTTTPPPSTSGNVNYTIPETYTGGEIWFSGTADTYYRVKYTAANFGSFTVVETGSLGGTLVPGREYWFPENGTILELKAQETVPGYVFNADRKVVNQAISPEEYFTLNKNNGVYSLFVLLDKNMDLVTTFEIRNYNVNLNISLPPGKTLAEVGSVSLTGGAAVLNAGGDTKVNYNGILTLNVSSNAGYAVRIKDGGNIKQSGLAGTYVYNTPPAKADVALEVEFIPLYQVNYGTDVAKVCRTDGTIVANGGWAYVGETLKAYSVNPSEKGKECKEVSVNDAVSGNPYGSSTTTLADGTIEYEFHMPGANVRVEAHFDWTKYNLTFSLNAPGNAGTLSVVKVVGGIETPVSGGSGVLSYGDMLKVIVALQPVAPGSLDTWYEVSSCSALMGGNNIALASSVSGLNYEYTLTVPVSDDVDITSVLVRKMQSLIVRVTPVNLGFNVKVSVDGGTPVEYASFQSIRVPVGATVEAWAQVTAAAPEGYELSSFPGTGEKETYVLKTVPSTTDLYLSAVFSLKEYPLNVKVVPDNGGRISFQDDAGNYYAKGKYKVAYGTVLSGITALPENDYFRLSGITGFMGGADRFIGQTFPYQIDKVVDSVGIEARFEKLYKVVKSVNLHGTMEVFEAGTFVNAENKFYPAGSSFTVVLIPDDESYRCSSAQILLPGSGSSAVSLVIDDKGKASYSIPAGLVATDLTFIAHFEKKKYKVTLDRTPDEGGMAELWVGDKATGTLLASLAKDDSGTPLTVDDVEHGTVIDFYTEADFPNYDVVVKSVGVNAYTVPVTIVSDTTFTVKFGKRYQVNIVDPENIHVYRENGVEVVSGELVPEGIALRVKAQKAGYNYTRLSVFKADDNTECYAWNNVDADGVIEEDFVMPAYDVKIDGVNEPRKYKVTLIASGKGVMTVSGWPGGIQNIVNTSVTSSSITHFTELNISALPDGESYLISKFVIYLPDGSQKVVTGADTTITITGNTNIEVVFTKYYWIVYDEPEHGQLIVQENGKPVVSGARYPGLTTLTVGTLPAEGYEVETLTANDAEILHNSVMLPLQDAVYDTLYLEAKFKIKTHTLTVIQPKEGKISVEKLEANGEWVTLDVTQPVVLDYWTQIRMQASVNEVEYNEFKELTVNGTAHPVGNPWVIKGDCQVEALITPRLFTVNYEHPSHGRLQVVTSEGVEVINGEQVPYQTQLIINAIQNDPEGYQVTEIDVNGEDIDNGGTWVVTGNVRIKASIAINRWEVATSVTGQGELPLLYRDQSFVQTPVDSVEHYQVLKISSRPAEGWQLYTLDVFGAEMRTDSTFMVTQDIQVNAVFRKKEPYLFPVVFTPNGDGYNDAWVVSGLWQSPDNTLEIYDRQQRRVYKSSPYMNEWEGTTDSGKVLPAGTYVYKFTTATGEEFMGLVSIMRK